MRMYILEIMEMEPMNIVPMMCQFSLFFLPAKLLLQKCRIILQKHSSPFPPQLCIKKRSLYLDWASLDSNHIFSESNIDFSLSPYIYLPTLTHRFPHSHDKQSSPNTSLAPTELITQLILVFSLDSR